mgnify:CR=1 FL=1|jgi:hypothetical protein
MTDAAPEDVASAPPILYTAYLSSVEDVVEHVKAADTLGLGLRIESYTIAIGDGEHLPEWKFELLTDMPVRQREEA